MPSDYLLNALYPWCNSLLAYKGKDFQIHSLISPLLSFHQNVFTSLRIHPARRCSSSQWRRGQGVQGLGASSPICSHTCPSSHYVQCESARMKSMNLYNQFKKSVCVRGRDGDESSTLTNGFTHSKKQKPTLAMSRLWTRAADGFSSTWNNKPSLQRAG